MKSINPFKLIVICILLALLFGFARRSAHAHGSVEPSWNEVMLKEELGSLHALLARQNAQIADLEAAVARYEHKMADQKNPAMRNEDSIEQLRFVVEDMLAEKKQLLEVNKELRYSINEIEYKLQKQTTQWAYGHDAPAKISTNTVVSINNSGEAEQLRSRVQELSLQAQSKDERIQDLKKQNISAQEAIKNLQSKVLKQSQKEVVADDEANLSFASTESPSRIEELESTLYSVQLQLRVANESVDQKKKEIGKLKKEMEKIKPQIQSLEQSVDEKQQQIEDSERAVAGKKAQLDVHKDMIDEKEKQLEALKNQLQVILLDQNKYESSLQEKQAQITNLQSYLSQTREELTQARSILEKKNTTIEVLLQKIDKAVEAKEMLAAKLDEKTESLVRTQEKAENLNERLDSTNQLLADTEFEANQKRQDEDLLNEALDGANEDTKKVLALRKRLKEKLDELYALKASGAKTGIWPLKGNRQVALVKEEIADIKADLKWREKSKRINKDKVSMFQKHLDGQDIFSEEQEIKTEETAAGSKATREEIRSKTQLEKELKVTQKKLNKAQKEISKKNSTRDELYKKNRLLELKNKDIRSLEGRLSKALAQIRESNERVEKIELRYEQVKGEFEELRKEYNEFREEHSDLQKENDRLSARLKDARKELFLKDREGRERKARFEYEAQERVAKFNPVPAKPIDDKEVNGESALQSQNGFINFLRNVKNETKSGADIFFHSKPVTAMKYVINPALIFMNNDNEEQAVSAPVSTSDDNTPSESSNKEVN